MTQPGDRVAGRFQVERALEGGRMGTLFRALDRVAGRPVALKVLPVELGEFDERFKREARVLAGLSHPAIVEHVDHGVTEDGEPYIAMEWLEGETLAVRLERGPLTVGESLALVRRAASALAGAHAQQIVHRDIKPSNLFLVEGRADRVKLLDFGIARRIIASQALTATGTAIGTAAYMSPERARGTGEVGPPMDIFSLGCVLFECLTGQPAYTGNHPVAILKQVVQGETPRVWQVRPELPQELDALVARMMAKDPAMRPADGAQLAAALERFDAPAA